MSTIYVVTGGEYSDYHIVAVFTAKPLAEAFLGKYRKERKFDGLDIEEYEANPYSLVLVNGYSGWRVRMAMNGDVTECCEVVYPKGVNGSETSFHDGIMSTHCFAKTREHAIKIANERRQRLIVLSLWGGQKNIENEVERFRAQMAPALRGAEIEACENVEEFYGPRSNQRLCVGEDVYNAVRWFEYGDHCAVHPYFGSPHVTVFSDCGVCGMPLNVHGVLNNPGGVALVCPGDWIGEHPDGYFVRIPDSGAVVVDTGCSTPAVEELDQALFKPCPSQDVGKYGISYWMDVGEDNHGDFPAQENGGKPESEATND